jgi:sugar phosphate isomerase/epimerase
MACTHIDRITEAEMTASFSRREFARLSAAAVAATAAAPHFAAAAEIKSPVGLQLYSVRELLPKDFDGTLAKVATLGYKNVEAAGYYNKTAAEWRKSMDAAGLRCTSTHHPLPLLKQHEDEYIEFAHAAGFSYLVCSSPMKKDPATPGHMTLDDWHWVADEFNRIGAKVKAAGLSFAYHNHVEVFVSIDGTMVYNELLSHTDPKVVSFEMDCGWVKAAGQDPLTWLTKTPGRFPLLHVKDMVKGDNGQSHSVVLGKGYIDYHPILRAAKGLKQYFVEQEEFSGNTPEIIFDELRQDAEYMKNFRV